MKLSTRKITRFAVGTLAATGLAASAAAADWSSAGRDLNNSRYDASEKQISPKTVAGLQLKWTFSSDGDVTANPVVDGQYLYFPDTAGSLYKVNKLTGALIWKKPVSGYTGIAGDYARASPAVSGNALIFGNQAGKIGRGAVDSARLVAVNKDTGALLWMTKVDPGQAMSILTHSPIVANGLAIIGIASNEELIAGFVPKTHWQWNFRGSVVAVDVATGAIKWKSYTVPAGFYGGSVWGSTGAVDTKRKLVYMATGDNFWAPDSVQACAAAAYSHSTSPLDCMPKDNYFDSVIALDLNTGVIKWGQRGLPYDVWNVGCGLNIPGVFTVPPNDNCPNPKGPDYDFGQGPMLFSGGESSDDSGDRDDDTDNAKLVGAGQKSGMFWAFNAKSGKLAWVTQAAPEGLTGGLQWGSATDGTRIYFAAANSGKAGAGQNPLPWPLKTGGTTTAGGWGALDVKTGKTLWTTKDPLGSRAEAAVSGANGVIFGCNLDATNGMMYAMDAKSGATLWSFPAGPPTHVNNFYSTACVAGPSISDGMVFWGSGGGQGYGPKKVFAFGL